MSMNPVGRPTGSGTAAPAAAGSALLPDEGLLFEIGDVGHSGVDLPDVEIDDYLTRDLDQVNCSRVEASRRRSGRSPRAPGPAERMP